MPSYPASASQLLGQTIDNDALRIEAILGAGSFGVVYRAVDTQTGVQYAVKCVEKDGSDYYQTRERELHARVSSHPHVLTFHREINAGCYAFFVYDLCAGDLHSVIRKMTFFREDELIRRVIIQIIDALQHCHTSGVYHRDLKPENILVSAQSQDMDVFLADFGLATTNKMSSSSCGTPCFMSPESLVPHHMPHSTVHDDIWALGCILAELIGNARPWVVASPEDRDYSDYKTDRTILFDVLPVSHQAYLLLWKIFSIKPERRPSLAAIRTEVLAIDTFFLSEEEAAKSGWTERLEKMMMRKIRARRADIDAPRRSSETSSGSCYESFTDASSSASRYSSGSSSSAFESSSAEWSQIPLTPPAPAVEAIHMDKVSSLLEFPPRVVAAHTC
ncbi:kinase-like domain-containing protein [Lactifluus subvellereus]|nr:kinase-like domain-containing protein [Lactifluus subvellereus]